MPPRNYRRRSAVEEARNGELRCRCKTSVRPERCSSSLLMILNIGAGARPLCSAESCRAAATTTRRMPGGQIFTPQHQRQAIFYEGGCDTFPKALLRGRRIDQLGGACDDEAT